MSNVQAEFHRILLVLRLCIYCIINIEVCLLLSILCITKQDVKTRFSQYFLVFFGSFKLKFRSATYCIFPCTEKYYQCAVCLEMINILYLEIKNLPLRTIHFRDSIYSFKVNNWNTRIMCRICSKLTTNISKRQKWLLSVNFNIIMKGGQFLLRYIHCPVFIRLNGLNAQFLTQIKLTTTQHNITFIKKHFNQIPTQLR